MAGYIGSRASVVSSGAERKKTFDITTTTTALTGLSYTPTFVHLFHNGVRLVDGTDYTATNGTSITLTTAAESGDQVVVVSYATFQAADAYTKAEADAGFVSDPNGAVTVDGSGNVGIGTAVPSELLEIEDGNMLFTNTVSNDSRIYFTHTTTANRRSYIGALETTGTGNALIFAPNANGADAAEAMRIDSSGNVLVGATTLPSSSVRGWGVAPYAEGAYVNSATSATASRTHYSFLNPNGVVGSINTSGTSTFYTTSSDYRLKDNITPIQGASDIVKAMRPCTYTFKADSTDWHDGFLAHELQELHPRAVIGSKDAMRDEEYEVTPAVEATYDDEGVELTPAVPAVMGTRSVPDYQGVDYSKLTPILTAALQEALNKIDALEARLTALEVTP
ncbi:MAG: tail fiber domain-containing protein [Yoonia sp.]